MIHNFCKRALLFIIFLVSPPPPFFLIWGGGGVTKLWLGCLVGVTLRPKVFHPKVPFFVRKAVLVAGRPSLFAAAPKHQSSLMRSLCNLFPHAILCVELNLSSAIIFSWYCCEMLIYLKSIGFVLMFVEILNTGFVLIQKLKSS